VSNFGGYEYPNAATTCPWIIGLVVVGYPSFTSMKYRFGPNPSAKGLKLRVSELMLLNTEDIEGAKLV
jgi:hypothetical protein